MAGYAKWYHFAYPAPNGGSIRHKVSSYNLFAKVQRNKEKISIMKIKDKKTEMIKSYLTPEEYKIISKNAQKAKLSISTYVRKIALGYEIKSKVDNEAVLALIKTNADLGRLGGLLKSYLGNENNNEVTNDIRLTLKQIEETKKNVLENVKKVTEMLQ